jgi:hypothetical protein
VTSDLNVKHKQKDEAAVLTGPLHLVRRPSTVPLFYIPFAMCSASS